jgi:hypothetical protein
MNVPGFRFQIVCSVSTKYNFRITALVQRNRRYFIPTPGGRQENNVTIYGVETSPQCIRFFLSIDTVSY